MAKGRRTTRKNVATADYRHGEEKRTNIPPAKIAGEGRVPKVEKVRYHYSPHLPPELRFDPTGEVDKLPLTADEQKLLADALRNHEPWLEWAGKREQHEQGFFEVDPVALEPIPVRGLEPGCREFESLRARHLPKGFSVLGLLSRFLKAYSSPSARASSLISARISARPWPVNPLCSD